MCIYDMLCERLYRGWLQVRAERVSADRAPLQTPIAYQVRQGFLLRHVPSLRRQSRGSTPVEIKQGLGGRSLGRAGRAGMASFPLLKRTVV
jgi:hypothetical protein